MQTLSTTRPIRQEYPTACGCTGSQKQQTPICSAQAPANAILIQSFLPLYEVNRKTTNRLADRQKTQKDFFDSVSILVKEYRIRITDYKNYSYPYNILLTQKDIVQELKKSNKSIELSIIEDTKAKVRLASKEYYPTNNTLFYIPVLPLFRLLQIKKEKKSAELILSVFGYLYHIARIPYYRENHSYLYYHYECIQDFLLDDFEEEVREDILATVTEFNKAFYYGDVILRKIYNPCHLNYFQKRIECYSPKTAFDRECLDIAQRIFEIMTEFPEQHIFQNTTHSCFDQNEEIISAEQYISFIADNEGILFDTITRTVNDELNECSDIDEPTIFRIYDSEIDNSTKNLDFENRLFPLLNDLCSLLNKIP